MLRAAAVCVRSWRRWGPGTIGGQRARSPRMDTRTGQGWESAVQHMQANATSVCFFGLFNFEFCKLNVYTNQSLYQPFTEKNKEPEPLQKIEWSHYIQSLQINNTPDFCIPLSLEAASTKREKKKKHSKVQTSAGQNNSCMSIISSLFQKVTSFYWTHGLVEECSFLYCAGKSESINQKRYLEFGMEKILFSLVLTICFCPPLPPLLLTVVFIFVFFRRWWRVTLETGQGTCVTWITPMVTAVASLAYITLTKTGLPRYVSNGWTAYHSFSVFANFIFLLAQ